MLFNSHCIDLLEPFAYLTPACRLQSESQIPHLNANAYSNLRKSQHARILHPKQIQNLQLQSRSLRLEIQWSRFRQVVHYRVKLWSAQPCPLVSPPRGLRVHRFQGQEHRWKEGLVPFKSGRNYEGYIPRVESGAWHWRRKYYLTWIRCSEFQSFSPLAWSRNDLALTGT